MNQTAMKVVLMGLMMLTCASRARAAESPRFAVIGDYGGQGAGPAQVAAMVNNWEPQYILTTGDNNYPIGAPETIDDNIGKYYYPYIYDYDGRYGAGSTYNRFFPAPGNHDWHPTLGLTPYTNYFTLPGNERYYDWRVGDIHFFAIDSDLHEPDGVTPDSIQGQWLKNALADSDAKFKIIHMHHPAFSSGSNHGFTEYMQWPFRAWGASLVLAGHEHFYERLEVNGLTYVTIGLGGNDTSNFVPIPHPASLFRFNQAYGALLMWQEGDLLNVGLYAVTNPSVPIDSFTIQAIPAPVAWLLLLTLIASHGPSRASSRRPSRRD